MVQGISFAGMASGMDTDEIVEQLMDIERISVRRLEAQKEKMKVEQELWQEVNQKLQSFDSSINDLRDRTSFESREVNSSDDNIMTATGQRGVMEANYQMMVKQLATEHRVGGAKVTDISANEEADPTTDLELAGTFTINNEEITVSEGNSLRNIRDSINESDAGVQATIMDGRLILNSSQTGEGNIISLDDNGGTVLKDLGIIDDIGGFVNELTVAQNALFEVDGLEVERGSNTELDDVIEGLTLNLNSANDGKIFNLSVTNDTEKTKEAISSFVEEYNAVQSYLGQLTQKDGLLQGDTTARRLSSNLRRQVTDRVAVHEDYNQISQLGIDIDEEGNMKLNDSILDSMLSERPEVVQDMFRAREENDGVDGIARRVRDNIQQYIRSSDGVLTRRESSLDSRMDRIDSRIVDRERRLSRREQSMRAQFTRMEVALNNTQAQGSWLSGQLEGLNANRNN